MLDTFLATTHSHLCRRLNAPLFIGPGSLGALVRMRLRTLERRINQRLLRLCLRVMDRRYASRLEAECE